MALAFIFSFLGIHGRTYKTFADYPVSATPYEEAGRLADGSVQFSLWAPTADSVRVHLYREGVGGTPVQTVRLVQQAPVGRGKRSEWSGLWTVQMPAPEARFYTFQIKYKGQWLRETPGLSARAVGVNGGRGALVDLASTNPEGWAADRFAATAPRDAIIYEAHHRDLTMHPSSGVPDEFRGKFAGTGCRAAYLRSLGVTHVHLLPSFDFSSVDETCLHTPQYNWGYDPQNYNVPDGGYSTDPYTPEVRIREFKEMVRQFHSQGLALILDVAYNHVADAGTSNFQLTVPDYFFRRRPDGALANASGCGNETASEREMMRRYMVESVRYWMTEYHVDGFRFDLMGVHDIETMHAIRQAAQAINPNALIYGEGWAAEPPQLPREKLALKANMKQLPGVAAFSDELRDALRGPFSDDSMPGMLGGQGGLEESVRFGIAGCVAHPQIDMGKVNYSPEAWAEAPQQMVAYVSSHDDMCLVDRLKASVPEASDNSTLERLDMLAQTAVFTSQGIPFILAGEEVMRSKKGVRNSYCSPDAVNAIDWGGQTKHSGVHAYYCGLMQLRTDHPGFRLGSADAVRRHLEFLPVEQGLVVAYRLKELHEVGDSFSQIVVVLNARAEAAEVSVPEGQYQTIAYDGVIKADGLGLRTGGRISVPARSALILAQ